jgi:hypothetical protein
VSVGPTAVGPAASSSAETIDDTFASAVHSGVTPFSAVGQARAGAQHSVSAVLNDRAQQAPLVIATPILASVIGAPDEVPGAALIPGLRPPAVRVDSAGGDRVLPGEEAGDPDAASLPPAAGSAAGTPRDGGAQAGLRFRELACDACFADGSWALDRAALDVPMPGAEAESSGRTPAAATAVAALALALGGFGGTRRGEAEERRRRLVL